jgi:DNA polymerase-3 subunit chi
LTEALFYHLERRRLDDVLPGLIERTLERGWRALIRVESSDRAAVIDSLLWTYSDDSFLPHAIEGDGQAAQQPVLITVEGGNTNSAQVLFLAGGAVMPDWGRSASSFDRIVLLFDGRDPEALASAREAWKRAKSTNLEVTYWKESAAGKWEKQGS